MMEKPDRDAEGSNQRFHAFIWVESKGSDCDGERSECDGGSDCDGESHQNRPPPQTTKKNEMKHVGHSVMEDTPYSDEERIIF